MLRRAPEPRLGWLTGEAIVSCHVISAGQLLATLFTVIAVGLWWMGVLRAQRRQTLWNLLAAASAGMAAVLQLVLFFTPPCSYLL
jgi:hypothetical protein